MWRAPGSGAPGAAHRSLRWYSTSSAIVSEWMSSIRLLGQLSSSRFGTILIREYERPAPSVQEAGASFILRPGCPQLSHNCGFIASVATG